MMQRPLKYINITPHLAMRLPELGHAQMYLDVLNSNREHLKPYMPWAHFITEVEQYRDFIKNTRKLWRNGEEYGYTLELDGVMIGRITLLHFDTKNSKAEIGYWIVAEQEGRGYITLATQKMIELAQILGFHRIEIRCAVGNTRSSSIPKRLGFQLEGILQHAEKTESGWRDLELYALLV